jgi:hypothetical protein
MIANQKPVSFIATSGGPFRNMLWIAGPFCLSISHIFSALRFSTTEQVFKARLYLYQTLATLPIKYNTWGLGGGDEKEIFSFCPLFV